MVKETTFPADTSSQALSSVQQSTWMLSLFVFTAMSLELHFFSSGLNLGVLILFMLAGIVVAHVTVNKTPLVRLHLHDHIYLFYIFITLASVAWSAAPSRTLIGALPQVALFILCLWLHRMPQVLAVRTILISAIVTGVVSILMVPVVPSLAFQPNPSTDISELRGIFKHQLRLGAFMMVATGLFILAYLNGDLKKILFKNHQANVLAFFLILGVLLMSWARLYMACGFVALGLAVFLSKRGYRKIFMVALIAFVSIAIALTFNQILTFLELQGFDTGLTGRTLTWQRTIIAMREGPQILGYGYRTFETPHFDYLFTGKYRPDHTHNSFLQAYFETGRVGQFTIIALAIAQFFASWRSSIRNNQFSYSLFVVIYVILGSLFGLNYAGALATIFCLMFLLLAIETRQEKSP